MNTISQIARFRQSVVQYSFNFGVPAAVRRFNVSRASVYRWRSRFNGQTSSLRDRSRRPHRHPNQHTAEELILISNMRRRNPNAGLVVFWVKLRNRGYSRSIVSLWRVLRRQQLLPVKPPNPKYIPKPYEKMSYPGQRVQVDVKVVPAACIVPNADGVKEKFFQYTAIDEYSRFRFVAAFKEQSTYSSVQFLDMLVKAFPFQIECIQTDNGTEFIKEFKERKHGKPSLFEARLKQSGIRHKLIRPYTPRHNGKVERSHRKDNERFYSKHSFYSLDDLQRQLKRYMREYNNTPMRPLGWKSPNAYLDSFFNDNV